MLVTGPLGHRKTCAPSEIPPRPTNQPRVGHILHFSLPLPLARAPPHPCSTGRQTSANCWWSKIEANTGSEWSWALDRGKTERMKKIRPVGRCNDQVSKGKTCPALSRNEHSSWPTKQRSWYFNCAQVSLVQSNSHAIHRCAQMI